MPKPVKKRGNRHTRGRRRRGKEGEEEGKKRRRRGGQDGGGDNQEGGDGTGRVGEGGEGMKGERGTAGRVFVKPYLVMLDTCGAVHAHQHCDLGAWCCGARPQNRSET